MSARRKSPAKPTPKTREDVEEFDIDALIAPLLSEIAASRGSASARETSGMSADEIAPAPGRLSETISAISASAISGSAISASVADSTDVSVAAALPTGESTPGAAADIDPMFFADDAFATPPPTPAQAERSAWLELVESLRQDIERLKAEREPRVAPPAPPPAPEQQQAVDTASLISAVRRRPPAPAANMPTAASRTARLKPRRPVEDQWGLFDPEQCGFAALLAKLDEISSRDDVSA